MARGPKKNYEEQLRILNEQIERYTQKINHLKEEKEQLLAQKREAEIKELYDTLQRENLSVMEAVRIIAGKETA